MLVVLAYSYILYIYVHIDGEVKRKIISTLQNFPLQDGESVLVLFWAAEEIKKSVYVLTTTFQPFLLSGNNKELHAYQLACLYHKLYVYRDAKEETAFGLAGMAYLYCTPQQTQNVHEYLEDQSLLCEDFSTKKLGACAVPVIDSNKCVCVLEFVTNTPRDFSNVITVTKGVLEKAGLRTTMQIDSTMSTYICPKERSRTTFTSPITSYCCLNKYFGLSSFCAAKALEGVIKHPLPQSTFRNLCRSLGIPEWPCIRNTTKTFSFITSNDDPNSNLDEGLSGVQIMTTIPSAQEIRTNPFASETSGDTGDWNESESEPAEHAQFAHPSLVAAIGDPMENQYNNIDPAIVHLGFMDFDLLKDDPLWCEKMCYWSGEQTMTSDFEALLSGFDFSYNNAPIANPYSMDYIGDFDIDRM